MPIELLPVPPPVLERPFWLGLELYNRLYPLGHLQAPKTHSKHTQQPSASLAHPALVAAFLPMASATAKRGVGGTSLMGRGILFLGHILALGGAGGAYEGEGRFRMTPCIGSFRELDRPLRCCTLSSW